MAKIIGIDPGLASTGIGYIEGNGQQIDFCSYGSVETAANTPLANRLDTIYSKIVQVLGQTIPELMVVEEVFSLGRNPKSGLTLGKVCGVVMLAGCRSGIPVIELPVREAKQVLTGNGNASKEQLERSVRSYLKLTEKIRPFHASDALALAIIGLLRFGEGLQD